MATEGELEKQIEKVAHSYLNHVIIQLRRCELISEQEVVNLCQAAKDILMKESNIREVHTPVTVFHFLHLFTVDLWRHPWSVL